jgi:hypothetical protein
MATVKITQDLLARTRNKVEHMRDTEIASIVPSFGKRETINVSHIYHLCTWGEENIPLVNQIPQDWLVRAEDADFRIKCDEFEEPIRLTVQGLTRAFRRPTADRWGGDSVAHCTESFLRGLPSHMTGLHDLLNKLEGAKTAQELKQKWLKISIDVEDFLSKCSTLNEAIKLFPNIRMYASASDLERHDRKAEKSAKRKEIVENLDMDSLTAAAVASRLSI